MLLGVSRQSVTKWEAQKSYPEMDKLLKMCQIFECSLDDLVQGDLTSRASEPAAATVPAGPPTDICGYDEHMRKLAWQVPWGVALVITGVAFVSGLEGMFRVVPTGWPANVEQAVPTILLFIFVGASLVFFIPAGMEASAFNKAHPYVEDFYTQAEKDEARTHMAMALVAGIVDILAGVCIMLVADGTVWEDAMAGVLLLFVATGVWIIIHWGMLLGRTNLTERNRDAADELEIEDIVSAQVDEEIKESLLAAKRGNRGRRHKITGAVCGTIMLVATIAALCWLFVPMFSAVAETGSWDALDSAKTEAKTSLFWLPWVIGGICCGIAALLIEAFLPDDK